MKESTSNYLISELYKITNNDYSIGYIEVRNIVGAITNRYSSQAMARSLGYQVHEMNDWKETDVSPIDIKFRVINLIRGILYSDSFVKGKSRIIKDKSYTYDDLMNATKPYALSLENVCDLLGVTRQSLFNWRKSKNQIPASVGRIIDILNTCGLDPFVDAGIIEL